MRCPDCNKFVSLETQEPEVDLEAEYTDGRITVNLSGRTCRNCADCGTELKALDLYESEEFEISDMECWADLTPEQQETIKGSADEVNVESTSSAVEESGGGRYKKNIITTIIDYRVEIPVTGNKDVSSLVYSSQFRIDAAASEFEEQV